MSKSDEYKAALKRPLPEGVSMRLVVPPRRPDRATLHLVEQKPFLRSRLLAKFDLLERGRKLPPDEVAAGIEAWLEDQSRQNQTMAAKAAAMRKSHAEWQEGVERALDEVRAKVPPEMLAPGDGGNTSFGVHIGPARGVVSVERLDDDVWSFCVDGYGLTRSEVLEVLAAIRPPPRSPKGTP